MLLLLVRHGLTPITGSLLTGRLPGIHLSEDGHRQAKEVAERLACFSVKAVYSSPLERCVETAEPIAARQKLEVRTVDDLAEVDYGDWQGKQIQRLYKLKVWSQLQAHPAEFRFPNGETIREAQTRGIRATEELLARHPRHAVVVVSHADIIRLILTGYMGLATDLYQRVTVGVASVSAVLLGGRVPLLLRVSDTGSLEELNKRLKPPAAAPANQRKAAPGRTAATTHSPGGRGAVAT
jgi:probable phosphomutase (TIGR03848 family)